MQPKIADSNSTRATPGNRFRATARAETGTYSMKPSAERRAGQQDRGNRLARGAGCFALTLDRRNESDVPNGRTGRDEEERGSQEPQEEGFILWSNQENCSQREQRCDRATQSDVVGSIEVGRVRADDTGDRGEAGQCCADLREKRKGLRLHGALPPHGPRAQLHGPPVEVVAKCTVRHQLPEAILGEARGSAAVQRGSARVNGAALLGGGGSER